MTEPEWLAAADPDLLLEFLRGKASDRKVRLLAVACCRHILERVSEPFSRKALGIVERVADGDLSRENLEFAWEDARRWARAASRHQRGSLLSAALLAVANAAEPDSFMAAARASSCASSGLRGPHVGSSRAQVWREQTAFLRDLVGNPFRPVAFEPRWRTSDVLGLARAIYEERAFDRLPILADALMDAGCADDQVLAHSRGEGPHIRGCWVVDLVLGKE